MYEVVVASSFGIDRVDVVDDIGIFGLREALSTVRILLLITRLTLANVKRS